MGRCVRGDTKQVEIQCGRLEENDFATFINVILGKETCPTTSAHRTLSSVI